jgi:hypothetical protein
MHDWLTIELVLAVLLVTSFTCNGLLALWAATSTRHWFVRTATLLGALSPLLLVRAYEPFVVFVAQSSVIAFGVFAYRRRLPERRFSLSALMLMMCLAAIAVTIAFRLPRLNIQAWITVGLNGLCAGFAVLLGVWSNAMPRRKAAVLLACVACLAMGAALSMFDWFIPSITNSTGWPPEPASPVIVPGFGDAERPIVTWFFIPLLVAAMTALATAFWKAVARRLYSAGEEHTVTLSQRKLRLYGTSFVLLIALISALPAYVLAMLLTPDPIPVTSLPTPNGYDDFVAAGRIVGATQLNGTLDVQTASPAQLAAEVKKCAEAYILVDAGLIKDCVAPVTYRLSNDSLPMDELIVFRSITRALYARGRVAEANGQLSEALDCYEQAVRLGYAVRRGGLLIHALVGMACSGIGARPLFAIREKLTDGQRRNCIQQLILADSKDEPYADVWQRDRVWAQRTTGWHGHLQQIITEHIDWKYDVLFISSEDYPLSYW